MGPDPTQFSFFQLTMLQNNIYTARIKNIMTKKLILDGSAENPHVRNKVNNLICGMVDIGFDLFQSWSISCH